MAQPGTDARPPRCDDDGVRVIREPGRRPWLALVMLAVATTIGWFGLRSPISPLAPPVAGDLATPVPASPQVQFNAHRPPPTATENRVNTLPATASSAPERPAEEPSGDPNDIAQHFRPGDPVPTTSELIAALRESGETGGIAAFNPPGTSPPLVGIAVPEDFELPPGYVRHHQVTDDGQPLEAILMFSPDFEFRDAQGHPLAIPEDRVVPPELASPGLPIRQIEIPPPPQ